MIKKRAAVLLFSLHLIGFFPLNCCFADDQDDGIPADDNIQQYDEIGNHAELNFSYLSQRARSKAAAGVNDAIVSQNGVLNSVILEPGAQINGDIIIIDQSKGNKTIITE